MGSLHAVDSGLGDSRELFTLGKSDNDDATLNAVASDTQVIEKSVADMEFRRMFSDPMDPSNCFLDINSGSGGTEAQDWAAMMLRMYSRWAERRGYKVALVDESEGDEAGIKSATIELRGEYAYGFAKAEAGVHRLIRLSPFNSGNTRQTSFALVEVLQENETTGIAWYRRTAPSVPAPECASGPGKA